jgi:hypothetical protein
MELAKDFSRASTIPQPARTQPSIQKTNKIIFKLNFWHDDEQLGSRHSILARPNLWMEPTPIQETLTASGLATSDQNFGSILSPPRQRKHWEKSTEELIIPLSMGLGEYQRATRSKSSTSFTPTNRLKRKRGDNSSPSTNECSSLILKGRREENTLSASSCIIDDELKYDTSKILDGSCQLPGRIEKSTCADRTCQQTKISAQDDQFYACTSTFSNRHSIAPTASSNQLVGNQFPLHRNNLNTQVFAARTSPPKLNTITQEESHIEHTRLKAKRCERKGVRDELLIQKAAEILLQLRDEDAELRKARMEDEALQFEIISAQKVLRDIMTGKLPRLAATLLLQNNGLYRHTLGFYTETIQFWQSMHASRSPSTSDVSSLPPPSTFDHDAEDTATQMGDIYEVLRKAEVRGMREKVLGVGRKEVERGLFRGKVEELWWRLFEKWSLPEGVVGMDGDGGK